MRWDASLEADLSDVNFAVTLFETGKIRFDYGAGNQNLSPIIGLSRGDGFSQLRLPQVDTKIVLQTSFRDLGAYEFRGSTLDITPPEIQSITPAGILGGDSKAIISQINITFSEEANPIDGLALANYELRESGANGIFEDGDDAVIAVTPIFTLGSNVVTLQLDDGILAPGDYRLFVSGDTSIHDLSGLRLDGDTDGSFIQFFTLGANEAPVIDDQTVSIDENSSNSAQLIFSDPNPGDSFSFTHDSAEFAIDDAGVITPLAPLDHELTPSFTITVTITDAQGLADSATMTIEIADVNEALSIADASFTVAENSTAIGTVSGTDPEDDTLS
ncbi:MAG: hypothetical protein ACI8W8_000395 [Rhodothermales bacterium]